MEIRWPCCTNVFFTLCLKIFLVFCHSIFSYLRWSNIYLISNIVLLSVPFVHFPFPFLWDILLFYWSPLSQNHFCHLQKALPFCIQMCRDFKKIPAYTHTLTFTWSYSFVVCVLFLLFDNQIFSKKWSRTVVYNWGSFGPHTQLLLSRDFRQCLETFLLQLWEMLLASRSQGHY